MSKSAAEEAQSPFDWIVIGSGPAGQRAAVQAAKLKKKVLIVERENWGGACVHKGTIPSKSLKEAALLNEARLENAWEKILLKKDRVLRNEADIIANQLDRNGVRRVRGQASFVSQDQIKVGEHVYHGKKFLIAVGTRPCRGPDFPWELADLYDSDTILEMKQSPESLLVIGAGVIGCEYASIFARLGVKVTLVDRRKELLRSVDQEIVERLKKHFEEMEITLEIGTDFSGLRAGPGGRGIDVELGGRSAAFSAGLVCMGREGNVDTLDLAAIGVKSSDRGIISVNGEYQTNLS
ncbi:MAG: FAD-dependent oxidoreductase, partial [Bdellovibrionota bacterium]